MTKLLITLAFVLAVRPASAQDRYYRSNEMGMLLAPVAAALKDDSRFVARVTRDGPNEDERLYDNGKEIHRWQTIWNADHSQRVELESQNGSLAARRVFDATDALLAEDRYSAGELASRIIFAYVAGQLVTRRELDPRGKETARDTYVYADNGSLREARRSTPDGATDTASVVSGWSGLAELRSVDDGRVVAERFDTGGRLLQRRRENAAGVKTVEEFEYDPKSGTLVSSRQSASDGPVVDRRYDAAGLLLQETTTLKGRTTETVDYRRDEKGRVIAKTRRGSAGIETWYDTYDDAGARAREEYFARGVRVKVTLYGEDRKRTEELYRRDGELFLKVFFDGDQRRREEVYADGELVHARDFP